MQLCYIMYTSVVKALLSEQHYQLIYHLTYTMYTINKMVLLKYSYKHIYYDSAFSKEYLAYFSKQTGCSTNSVLQNYERFGTSARRRHPS